MQTTSVSLASDDTKVHPDSIIIVLGEFSWGTDADDGIRDLQVQTL